MTSIWLAKSWPAVTYATIMYSIKTLERWIPEVTKDLCYLKGCCTIFACSWAAILDPPLTITRPPSILSILSKSSKSHMLHISAFTSKLFLRFSLLQYIANYGKDILSYRPVVDYDWGFTSLQFAAMQLFAHITSFTLWCRSLPLCSQFDLYLQCQALQWDAKICVVANLELLSNV